MARKIINGYGTITYPSGSTYTGEFRVGKFNGQGIATYADGVMYTGEWKDGELVP